MTISIILGTRPEIIKTAPVIRECERRSLDYSVIHTGQHYSYQMGRIFFEQLELPLPHACDKIPVTGNTIVDSVNQSLDIAKRKVFALGDLH